MKLRERKIKIKNIQRKQKKHALRNYLKLALFKAAWENIRKAFKKKIGSISLKQSLTVRGKFDALLGTKFEAN